MGWQELENGDLLKAAEDSGFDLMLTGDKNLSYAAALLVLDRPWRVRVWHWLTLPRPAPARRSYARRRYRRNDPAGLIVMFLVVGLVIVVSVFKPDLPPWMPAAVIRAAYLVERLRY